MSGPSGTTVSPLSVGIGGAVLGAAAGAFFAPASYNLEELIKLDAPTFEKSLSKNAIDSADGTQKSAYKGIIKARDTFKKSGDAELQKLLKQDNTLVSAYKELKSLIPKSRGYGAIVWGISVGLVAMILKILATPGKPHAPIKTLNAVV